MNQTLATLRLLVTEAVREELRARRTIGAVMSAYLGGSLTLIARDESKGGGLRYAAWTDSQHKRGLIVRQDRHGAHVAIDLGRSLEIGRGDGLRGVQQLVVRHFMGCLPKDARW